MPSTTWISSGRAAAAAILQVPTSNDVMPLPTSICSSFAIPVTISEHGHASAPTLCDSVPFKQWCIQSSQHLRARKWRCAMHGPLRLPCTAPVWDIRLDEPSYAPSCCSQGDFAFLPAVPLSPHVHVVGGLTPRPAKQLPPELLRLCEASQPSGIVYVSMGTTAIPGRFVLCTISTTWLRCDPPTSMLA